MTRANFDRRDYLTAIPFVPLCLLVTVVCRWLAARDERRSREVAR